MELGINIELPWMSPTLVSSTKHRKTTECARQSTQRYVQLMQKHPMGRPLSSSIFGTLRNQARRHRINTMNIVSLELTIKKTCVSTVSTQNDGIYALKHIYTEKDDRDLLRI